MPLITTAGVKLILMILQNVLKCLTLRRNAVNKVQIVIVQMHLIPSNIVALQLLQHVVTKHAAKLGIKELVLKVWLEAEMQMMIQSVSRIPKIPVVKVMFPQITLRNVHNN